MEKDIKDFINKFYCNNEEKVKEWYKRRHSFLGDSPENLIKSGQVERVYKFVTMVKN